MRIFCAAVVWAGLGLVAAFGVGFLLFLVFMLLNILLTVLGFIFTG